MADAVFAVNHIKVDWNEHAVKSVRQYLSGQSFVATGACFYEASGAAWPSGSRAGAGAGWQRLVEFDHQAADLVQLRAVCAPEDSFVELVIMAGAGAGPFRRSRGARSGCSRAPRRG